MATLDARYKINGLIDSSRPVLDNLEQIANSCNTWLTYDSVEGKWSVVINQAGDPVASFDDSDIVGSINLSTTELAGFYNSSEVRFHNQELRDQTDYVLLEIPDNQRLGDEPDNRLIIDAPLVNNQIQAQLIGLIELKQSRLEKTIEFAVDYKHLGLEAGSIIEITNTVYGWTDQKFRILRIDEREQDGSLVLGIRAQEYNPDVYNTSDLFEYLTEKEDGIFQLDPYQDAGPLTPSMQLVDEFGNPIGTNSPYNMMSWLDQLLNGNYGPLYAAIQALNANRFIAGTNMNIAYNPIGGTLTFNAGGGGGGGGGIIYNHAPNGPGPTYLAYSTDALLGEIFTITETCNLTIQVDVSITEFSAGSLNGTDPNASLQFIIELVDISGTIVYASDSTYVPRITTVTYLRPIDHALRSLYAGSVVPGLYRVRIVQVVGNTPVQVAYRFIIKQSQLGEPI